VRSERKPGKGSKRVKQALGYSRSSTEVNSLGALRCTIKSVDISDRRDRFGDATIKGRAEAQMISSAMQQSRPHACSSA
jgi:hypothetical protein